jgi:predicted Zn-dependent protease
MKASHKVGIALVAVCIVYVATRFVVQHNEQSPTGSPPGANNAPVAGTAGLSGAMPGSNPNTLPSSAPNPESAPFGATNMQAPPQSPNSAGAGRQITATNAQLQFPGSGNQSDWNQAITIYAQACRQLAGQQYDQAYTLFQQAINKYPYDSHFYNNMAVVCFQRGRLEEGEKLSQQAIRLKPDEWDYWNNFALGLGADNKNQDARAALAKALQCNPPAGKAAEIKQNIAILDQALQGAH